MLVRPLPLSISALAASSLAIELTTMLRPRGRRRVWQFLTQTHIAADNDESLAREASNGVVRHMEKLFAVALRILLEMMHQDW